jgi:hypothetical protein
MQQKAKELWVKKKSKSVETREWRHHQLAISRMRTK